MSKAFGAYMSSIVKRLKRAGLRPDQLELAQAALKARPDAFRLSRRMAQRVARMVDKEGAAVVTRSRVFTVAGYKAKQAAGNELRREYPPKATKKAYKLKAGRGLMRQPKRAYVHWTQKPENRGKVVAANQRMVEARKAKRSSKEPAAAA